METRTPTFVTRFAPAPTGYLHMGHVAAAACVWGMAQHLGARVLLRLEDHDRQRCRPEYRDAIIADLDWLGFCAAPDPLSGAPFRTQSADDSLYASALAQLAARGLVYPCRCSRQTLRDLHGMPDSGTELMYPGTCRGLQLTAETGSHVTLRLRVEPRCMQFVDLWQGSCVQEPYTQVGDFPIRDREGNWTYHFACVVDDLQQGVNLIVRGTDILPSTGRQLYLWQLLSQRGFPRFCHHPVILDDNGRKLSKRFRSSPIQESHKQGVDPAQLIGTACYLLGLVPTEKPVHVEELGTLFAHISLPGEGRFPHL